MQFPHYGTSVLETSVIKNKNKFTPIRMTTTFKKDRKSQLLVRTGEPKPAFLEETQKVQPLWETVCRFLRK